MMHAIDAAAMMPNWSPAISVLVRDEKTRQGVETLTAKVVMNALS